MRSVQPLNQNISDKINVAKVIELQVYKKYIYRTPAIKTRGLYTFYLIFEDQKR
jgi:hypothetical protein